MKELKNYGHIHLDAEDKDYGMIMPCIIESGNKHRLIDDWADLNRKEDMILGEYDTAFEAIKAGIKMIKKKFPNAKIMYGAGQPPNEMLDEILKSEPQTPSPSDSKTNTG